MTLARHLLSTTTVTLALAAAATLTTFDATAQTAQPAGCAEVEVQQVRPRQGFLMLAAYGDADSFNKKPLVALRVAAGDAVTKLQVCGLGSSSEVALAMYQDLDSDGQMGKNLLGIPTEPWGSSGTPGTFGPTWATGRVPLDGKTIVVKLSS